MFRATYVTKILPLYFVIYSAADFDLKAIPCVSVHVN